MVLAARLFPITSGQYFHSPVEVAEWAVDLDFGSLDADLRNSG